MTMNRLAPLDASPLAALAAVALTLAALPLAGLVVAPAWRRQRSCAPAVR